MIPLVGYLEHSIPRDRNWKGGFGGGWEGGVGGLPFNGYRIPVLQGGKGSGGRWHNKCEHLDAPEMDT